MRCRRNVKSMTSQEKADFARAIVLLKAEPSVLHPGSQNRYDDYVEIHRGAMAAAIIQNNVLIDPGWAHFDSAFLPWHRELLYRFEEDLRLLVPGVTVPYWDWTRGKQPADAGWPFTHDFLGVEGTQSANFQDGTNNQVLRDPANAATNPYPFEFDPEAWTILVRDADDARHWPGLTRNFADEYDVVDAPSLPDNDAVVPGVNTSFRDSINAPDYLELRARSEDIHNLVHRWVGGVVPLDLNSNLQIENDEVFVGDMLAGSSPNDPVFWLHHAAIDRMWSIWQEKNPGQSESFYYQHLNGFQGHGIDDDLIFNGPASPSPFVGSATPRQMIDGHAQHGVSIWYESDLPEITQETGGTLDFGGVPAGLTQYRAVRFRVTTCRSMSFRIVGEPTGDFGTPEGLEFPVVPDLDADYLNAYVWVSYQANGGAPSSQIVIEAYLIDEEGYYAAAEGGEHILGTYTVDIEGETLPLEDNAAVLVLDRSGSMGAAAGGGSTRTQLLRDAVEVFHTLMRPADEVGIVSFDDLVETPLPLTTQAAGLGTTLSGGALDPRGLTGIGQAILEGATMLNGATHANRSILVLTDGNENQDPRVADLPAGTIHDRVYAIGFGLQGQVSDQVLNEITQNSGGDLVVTGELSSQEEEYLLSKYFIQVLAGVTSLSVVLDPRGELTWGQRHVIPFELSGADVAVDVIALAGAAPLLDVDLITPTGKVITPQVAANEPNASYRSTDKLSFYRMMLPAIASDPGGSHAGAWKAVLSLKDPKLIKEHLLKHDSGRALEEFLRKDAVSYNCVVQVRSNLQFSAAVRQNTMEPGETVGLEASLSEYTVPYGGSATVWCEVVEPDGSTTDLRLAREREGRYAGSFAAAAAGIYRLRFRAEGRTRDGHSFQREKTMSASTFLGGPGKEAGSSSGRGREEELCKLLECLLSERVIDARLEDRLREWGLDVDSLRNCVERYCSDGKRTMPTEARHGATAPATPSVSKILARQLLATDLKSLLRPAGVASPVDRQAKRQRDRSKAERKALTSHKWSPMKPAKEVITKRVRKNVKVEKPAK